MRKEKRPAPSLTPDELKRVTGGSPTLPLPPPKATNEAEPQPLPW